MNAIEIEKEITEWINELPWQGFKPGYKGETTESYDGTPNAGCTSIRYMSGPLKGKAL